MCPSSLDKQRRNEQPDVNLVHRLEPLLNNEQLSGLWSFTCRRTTLEAFTINQPQI